MTVPPVIFESESGNAYFYDDAAKIIMCIKGSDELDWLTSFQETGVFDSENIPAGLKMHINSSGVFLRDNSKIIAEDLVREKLNTGISELLLETAGQCGSYCQHCDSGGHCLPGGEGAGKKMSWETAREAINYYFSFNLEGSLRDPAITPLVIFSGNDALANFELIGHAVKYIKKCYSGYFTGINFHLLTDGILLTEQIIRFLLENRVTTVIRIPVFAGTDGRHEKETENTFPSGQIIKNMKLFEKIEKEYGDMKSFRPFEISCRVDFKDSFLSMIGRLKELDMEPERFGNFSFTDYIGKSSGPESRSEKISESFFDYLLKTYMEEPEDNFFRVILERMTDELLRDLDGGRTADSKFGKISCFSGLDRLTVSAEGDYFACGKMNWNNAIGNIKRGLAMFSICSQIYTMENISMDYCSKCSISNLCRICIKDFADADNKFMFSLNVCDRQRKTIASLLKFHVTRMELAKSSGLKTEAV